MGLYAFIVSIASVVVSAIVCYCCGLTQGKRAGTSSALRNYAHRLERTANAPQIGSYTSALAADASLQPEVALGGRTAPTGPLLGGFGDGGIGAPPKERSSTKSMISSYVPKPPVPVSDRSRVTASERADERAELTSRPWTDEVGVSLVDLDGARSEEAMLVPPSSAGGGGRGGGGGSGGPPVMHLQALQDAESELIPPSTAGGRSAEQEDLRDDAPSDSGSVANGGVLPPPTPPRSTKRDTSGAGGAVGPNGSYEGSCLVQMPDENGRWQPVKVTASMCGSPVGSINPSLAASETTVGGKSLRYMRGGPASIPEVDYEDDELG